MSALLPCPFCGGEAEIEQSISGTVWTVWCPHKACYADAEVRGDTEPAAIAAWNRRAEGWMPIETAPRDKPIIVYQDGEQAVVTWMTALEDGAGDWIIWRRVGSDALAVRMPEPTHWRHLPTPPAGDAP